MSLHQETISYEDDDPDAVLRRDSARELRIESVDDEMAAVLRRKTPGERLEIAFGMIDSAISMLRHMLADQHPEWSAEEVQAEVARRIFRGEI